MKLLDQSAKTNWKFIAIVGFVAVFLAGGILMLIPQFQEQSSPPLPQPSNSQIETPSPASGEIEGWQTYRNDEFGFEIQYPKEWRAHVNSFTGSPNMIFCPPEFFAENKEWWIAWSEEKEGCAASPRIWAQNGTILIEGTGEVTEGEFKEIWEERLTESIFTVYLFETSSQQSPREGGVYRGPDSFGRYWELWPGGLNRFTQYLEIFQRMVSTFRFLD